MHKARIKEWGLDKKLKEHEARAMFHVHVARQGKRTKTILRGQEINLDTITKYFKRKGIATEDIPASKLGTLQDLTVETPPPSPHESAARPAILATSPTIDASPLVQELALQARPRHLRSPEVFRAAETWFAANHEHVQRGYGTGLWNENMLYTFPFSANISLAPPASVKMFNRVGNCSLVVERKDWSGSMTQSWDALDFAHSVVRKPLPETLSFLLCSLAYLLKNPTKSKAIPFCRQVKLIVTGFNLTRSSVGAYVRDVIDNLEALTQADDAAAYLLTALRSWTDVHSNLLGPLHLQTVLACTLQARVMATLHGPTGLLAPLESLLQVVTRDIGPRAPQRTVLIVALVELELAQGRHQAAMRRLSKLLKPSDLSSSESDHAAQHSADCDDTASFTVNGRRLSGRTT